MPAILLGRCRSLTDYPLLPAYFQRSRRRILSQDSFGAPPIPVHLAQFPVVGGLVVPYITLRHRNGAAALGLVDYNRTVRCFTERRCGVCGGIVAGRMVFLMRSFDLTRKLSSEPGLCPPCAAYAIAACPMLTGQMAHYRQSRPTFIRRRCDDPECECSQWISTPEPNRYGAAAERWLALWTTQYRLVHDARGRLAAGFAGVRVLSIREIRQPAPAPSDTTPIPQPVRPKRSPGCA
jgi:hypothetical protein